MLNQTDDTAMTKSSARVILIEEAGSPDVLIARDATLATPGPGELLVRQTYAGVNFHDIYVRSGLYRTLALPGIPGLEAVGVVEATGDGVTDLRIGDRIGYITEEYGAYSTRRLLPAEKAIRLSDSIGDLAAVSMLVKGFTAAILVSRAHRVMAGETILIHAAAGGMGQLLCSWARHLGAKVIGTVGSEAKVEIAKQAGADHVILYREQDFVAATLELTNGKGVNAVYDAVGKDTFTGSLACLDYLGTLINYGQASGPVAPFTPAALAARSLTLVRPLLFHYIRDRRNLEALATEVFTAISTGVLSPPKTHIFTLEQACEAHQLLESRESTGAVILACEG